MIVLKICFALLCLFSAPAFANPANDVIAINSGSEASVGGFQADVNFSGGNTYTSNLPISRANAADPAPEAVYQSNRFGNFSYLFSNLQPGVAYKLRLHFAEVYWDAAGARVFNVAVNGNPVLTNFDIFAAAGGKGIALVREIPITANAFGNIEIQFTTLVDNALLSGIELALENPLPPHPTPGYNISLGADRSNYLAGQKATVMVSLQNLPDNENYEFYVEAKFNGSDIPLTKITDTTSYAVTPALAAGDSQLLATLYLQNKEEAKALCQAVSYYNSEIARLNDELSHTTDPSQIAAIQAEIAKDQNRLDSTKDHLRQVRTPVGTPVTLTLTAQ